MAISISGPSSMFSTYYANLHELLLWQSANVTTFFFQNWIDYTNFDEGVESSNISLSHSISEACRFSREAKSFPPHDYVKVEFTIK